eukprot:scaffold61_cov180-Ochromonas_danica.AAC.5
MMPRTCFSPPDCLSRDQRGRRGRIIEADLRGIESSYRSSGSVNLSPLRVTVQSAIIDLDTIENIVADLSSNEEDLAQESLQLFDAFRSPKLQYDEKTRQYKIATEVKYDILAKMEARAGMYRERLLLTQQRLLRSELFTLRVRHRGQQNADSDEISTVESLLGSSGVKILVGYLTQPEEGQWCLEDLTGLILLDLSSALTYPLLYTEGSIVVLQGERNHLNMFVVQVMGFPPAEERATTLKALNMIDTFSPPGHHNWQHHEQMAVLEEQAHHQLIVILSDLHLDKPSVLDKFLQLLQGYDQVGITPLYVLMGSFLSQSLYHRAGGNEAIRKAFQALAETIGKVPNQRDSAKFLLIPGPLDAGSNPALPRRSLPAFVGAVMSEKVAHISFGSNPCRLRCYTQEIVFFREDLLRKMQRNLVVPLKVSTSHSSGSTGDDIEGDEEGAEAIINDHQNSSESALNGSEDIPDVTEQLVESLLDQGHLCPLPALAAPIIWELGHTLRLFPLPHLLVLADHTDQFSYEYKGCRTINPGTFASDFSFIVYHPANKEVQFSRVP